MQNPTWLVNLIARPLALLALLGIYHHSPIVGLMVLAAMFGFVVARPEGLLRRVH